VMTCTVGESRFHERFRILADPQHSSCRC
jgi:hypothetical protein